MRVSVHPLLVFIGLSSAVACSNPLTVESLEGTYTATTFMLVGVGNVIDVGGTFTMTIGS